MRNALLPIGLGLFAPIAFILGGAPFDVPGRNPPAAFVAGSLAVALYFTVVAFGLFRDVRRTAQASRPIFAGLLLSLLAVCVLVSVLEGGNAWLLDGLPMLLSGSLGVGIGFFFAFRKPVPTTRSNTE